MKINEVAKFTGVTVRTLHYYDQIDLLKPSKTTQAGYRIYDESDLKVLQQILFFRELDFPLNEIKEIMKNSAFDTSEALKNHKDMLMKKRKRIDKLINLVNNTIKGEKTMSFKEFDITEIEKTRIKYAKEVKERWGNSDVYMESKKKTNDYSTEQWSSINDQSNHILKAFAQHKNENPEDLKVQTLVKEWQDFITERFYNCTNEILSGLALMYVQDERFKQNIDKHGEGTALFMAKAIECYVKA